MSLSFNKVIVAGNLTRDPELRHLPKGTALCKIGIAVNRKWKQDGEDKQETTFVDVDLFGKPAENAGQYLKKGSPVLIEGRLKMDNWDDKATGQKRSKLGVMGESIQFLGKGEQQEQPATQQQARQGFQGARQAVGQAPAAEADDTNVPF